MCEVHLIIVLGEGMRECQCEVASTKPIPFTFESVGVVTDVLADTMP